MTDVETALSEGVDALFPLAPFLAIPTVLSVLHVEKLRRVAGHSGPHVGVRFALPVPIADLWTFVNAPKNGVSVSVFGVVAGDLSIPEIVAVAAVFLVLYGFLAGGYLGSIHEYRRRGSYHLVENAVRYGPTYVVLGVALLGPVLALPFLITMPPLLLLAVIVFVAVAYLFWGAWFLVPVADVGAVEALARSFRLATEEGGYLVWTLVHLVLGAVLSVVATFLVVSLEPLPFAVGIGLVIVIPAGFVLTVASLSVVDDLADERWGANGHDGRASP